MPERTSRETLNRDRIQPAPLAARTGPANVHPTVTGCSRLSSDSSVAIETNPGAHPLRRQIVSHITGSLYRQIRKEL
jgi:hypothetical protein